MKSTISTHSLLIALLISFCATTARAQSGTRPTEPPVTLTITTEAARQWAADLLELQHLREQDSIRSVQIRNLRHQVANRQQALVNAEQALHQTQTTCLQEIAHQKKRTRTWQFISSGTGAVLILVLLL